MAKHYFILNPMAGIKNVAASLSKAIHTLFSDPSLAEEEYEIVQTKERGEATRLAREACESTDGEIRIYAMGGDGTLHEVVNGVIGYENAAVCPVPVGSGNDFIRYFDHLKKEDFLDLAALIEGEEIRMDVLKCGDIYSLNSISAGLDAYTAKRQVKIKRWPLVSGGLAYKIGLVYSFLTAMKNPIRFQVDGEELTVGEGNVTLAVLGNGKWYGGGFCSTPLADISDGLMDLCTVPTISRFTFLRYVGDYKRGEHLSTMPSVVYKKCKRIRLISPKPIVMQADGELFEATNPDIEIIPAALRLVLPAKGTVSLAKCGANVVK